MYLKRHFYLFSLSLLLCLLLSGINNRRVFAQSPTPQPPTSTWEPLYKTPTAQPTSFYECPPGLPTGFGTLTPSPLWLAGCNKCLLTLTPGTTITPVPGYTSVFASSTPGTSTPGTPTPGTTATVIPATSIPYTATPNDGLNVTVTGSHSEQNWNGTQSATITCIKDSATASHCNWSGTIYQPSTNNNSITWRMSMTGVPHAWGAYYALNVGTIQGRLTWPGGTYYGSINQSAYATFILDYSTNLDFGMNVQNVGAGTYTSSGVVYLNFRENPATATSIATSTAMATVTPTSTPAGNMCQSVQGLTSSESGAELPIPRLGPPTCSSFGGFTMSLSSLNWIPGSSFSDVTVPLLNVCFQPMLFGKLIVLGYTFDLDNIMVFMASITILFLIMRQ